MSFLATVASAFPIIAESVPTIAVAAIYCLWMRAYMAQRQREQRLRGRIAYMLWSAATEVE
jgi:hypothetical protein